MNEAFAAIDEAGVFLRSAPVSDKAGDIFANRRGAGKTGRLNAGGVKETGSVLRFADYEIATRLVGADT